MLYHLERTCFGERHFRREHLDWILRNPRAVTLIEDGGTVMLGALMLLFEGSVCRVLSVAVVPDARRRGLGSRLMRAAEEASGERRCTVVRLEVSTENPGAVEFYRRLGYEVDGILPGYYSWGEDAFSMHKIVPSLSSEGGALTRPAANRDFA